jgi:hypothetical protein
MGGLPVWGLYEGLTTSRRKKKRLFTKCYTGLQTWAGSLERPRQRKMDMKFGIWNVRSLYRAGSLKTAASELSEYNTSSCSTGQVE